MQTKVLHSRLAQLQQGLLQLELAVNRGTADFVGSLHGLIDADLRASGVTKVCGVRDHCPLH